MGALLQLLDWLLHVLDISLDVYHTAAVREFARSVVVWLLDNRYVLGEFLTHKANRDASSLGDLIAWVPGWLQLLLAYPAEVHIIAQYISNVTQFNALPQHVGVEFTRLDLFLFIYLSLPSESLTEDIAWHLEIKDQSL